jgi:hypothetical protein
MLILLRVRLSNKKVRQNAALPILSSFGRAHPDDHETNTGCSARICSIRRNRNTSRPLKALEFGYIWALGTIELYT